MSERKKHIAVLKEMLEWMNMSSEVIKKDDPFFRVHEHRKKAVKYAISSLETDEAYQLEYESTTKNDLGVKLISKSDVDRIIDSPYFRQADKLIQIMNLPSVTFKKPCDICRHYENGCHWLSSVTPQEPRKGHWVLTDVEGNKVWHCHCSECGKDPQDYVGGSENWWLIKSKLPKFCPSCGSDNREVEE